MNQLFYTIAGGIVYQIRREKQTTISEVIVQWGESWRHKCRVSFSVVFSFSASFKNSSPREKVAKLSSFWDWWAESLFVSITRIVAKCNIFPSLTTAARAKNSGESVCSRNQRAQSRFWARLHNVHWIWLRGSASYVIITFWLQIKLKAWAYLEE